MAFRAGVLFVTQKTSVVDLHLFFNAGPDQVLDTDPGISKPKLKKISCFFLRKLQYIYPKAFIKDVQIRGEASSPQREHPAFQKINF
jgi:hypothetical protein